MSAMTRQPEPVEETPAPIEEEEIDPTVTFASDRVITERRDVAILGGEVVISGNGPYLLRGSLEGYCLHVVSKGKTTLILDGLEIRNTEGAALLSDRKCSLSVVLSENTENVLSAGSERELAADPDATGAALDAKGDLEISGQGLLRVQGYINNAIRCREDLVLRDGARLELLAANRGIKTAFLSLDGASCDIRSGGEGVYSEEDVHLADSVLSVETPDQCIQSAGAVRMDGGSLHLSSENSDGIKAALEVALSGEEIEIDAMEDGIKSEKEIALSGGRVQIRAAGDGLRITQSENNANPSIRLLGGEILISTYGIPLRTRSGCFLEEGVSLLATGIQGKNEKLQIESAQPLRIESRIGSKRDLLHVKNAAAQEAELSMETAYGYNVAAYSLPGITNQKQLRLTIG